MSEQTPTLTISGLDELADSFESLVGKYPDKAGDLLRKDAMTFRRKVAKRYSVETDGDKDNKFSLLKPSSYKISQIKGFGEMQYIEITAKSPHFHLVEKGHQLVLPNQRKVKDKKTGSTHTIRLKNGGTNVGYVPGYHIMDNQARIHQEEMPSVVEDMIDKLLEEEGLI